MKQKTFNIMSTYQKVSSITLSETNTKDAALVIAAFSKSALQDFLDGINNNDVAIYFIKETAGLSNDFKIVLGETDSSGEPTGNKVSSGNLPCPPYCPS